MGKEKYRFKLSDLMPNSWFYKLKDVRGGGNRASRGNRTLATQNSMDKSKNPCTEPLKSLANQRRNLPSPSAQPYTANRPSYYITTGDRAENLPLYPTHHKNIDTMVPIDEPRISDKKHKKSISSSNNLISSVSSVFTCRNQSSSIPSSHPTNCHRLHGLDEDFKDEFILSADYLSTSDIAPSHFNPGLPPILTKPRAGRKQSIKPGNFLNNGRIKRSPSGPQHIKLKIKSPKLAMKIVQKKKGLSESFVVVKSSSDPQRDFRESMVEMIVENNLCSWKDMEELLSCYLSLNSGEYHDLIVRVFKQILFDLTELMLQS